MTQIGKREFTLHTSRYLKRAEKQGEAFVITHQGKPCLKLVPFKSKTIRSLRGLISERKDKEPINKPVLPPLEKWSS